MGTIYTQSDSGFMEDPYFEKLADFSCVMWICGGFAPHGPSTLLIFFIFWPFMGQKVVFGVKKTVVLSVLDRV